MKNYVLAFGGVMIAMVAYMSWLDHRDQQLFDSYNRCLTTDCRK